MNFRLKTSKKAQDILLDLKSKTNITPNILARYAISLSLLDPNKISKFNYDNNGLEFQRHILTGKYDCVYKALIIQHAEEELTDDDYFPKYIKAHLERGIHYLNSEYNYAGNYEKFITALSDFKFELANTSFGGNTK